MCGSLSRRKNDARSFEAIGITPIPDAFKFNTAPSDPTSGHHVHKEMNMSCLPNLSHSMWMTLTGFVAIMEARTMGLA